MTLSAFIRSLKTISPSDADWLSDIVVKYNEDEKALRAIYLRCIMRYGGLLCEQTRVQRDLTQVEAEFKQVCSAQDMDAASAIFEKYRELSARFDSILDQIRVAQHEMLIAERECIITKRENELSIQLEYHRAVLR